MSLLTLQDVSHAVADRQLLNGISLVIGDDADRVGILGPNGCGKSTLLQILAGTLVPDHGQRTTRRGLRLEILNQDPTLPETATAAEAVRAGLTERDKTLRALDAVHEKLAVAGDDTDRLEALLREQAALEERLEAEGGHDVDHRIEAMIDALGLAQIHDTPCGAMSGGERRRVALARALLRPSDVLLLDEPTNHLDAEVIAWLEQRLAQRRGALVLVTHDRYFLDRLVTRTIEIESGILHEYAGGYGAFLAARTARLEREAANESTRLNLLRRETEWMRRGPPARTTKAKARIDRYEQLADAAPESAARDLEFEIPPGPRLGDKVLAFDDVSAGYDGKALFRNLDVEIGPRSRLGIVGPNGAGKSTFLKLCLGTLEPTAGRVVRGSTVRFAAIDQRRSDLDPEKSVLEEVSGGNDFVHVDGRSIRIESFLDRFLFPGAMKHAKVGTLSGGERNRVLLAKLLSAGGNVLILDEPTNDLDLMTLRVLEEALCAFPGVVLVVSHDRYFLDRVATRILRFEAPEADRVPRPTVFEGDLSMLLEKIAQAQEAERTRIAKSASKREPSAAREPSGPSRPKLSTREQRELDALPDAIAEAEAELERLDAILADPATWTSAAPSTSGDVTADRERARAEVDRLYARWEELETRQESARPS